MANKKILLGILAIALVLSGCLTAGGGDTNQNNLGVIDGDNYALVRVPAGTGLKMAVLAGKNLTGSHKYKITRPVMGFGGTTIDLKVTPGSHEFTLLHIYDTGTMITTQSYDFKAGKWYDFKKGFLTDDITIREGTLEAGKVKGKASEVTTFQIDKVYNSDAVAPAPQQVSFRGNPDNVTADKVIVTLTDGAQPGQVVLTLSDGFKFGPKATAANVVKWWMTYPTYPVTVSPAHCTGSFNSSGTQMTITMKTSNNRTVTSGSVGFKSLKMWDNAYVFLPDPPRNLTNFVLGRSPSLD